MKLFHLISSFIIILSLTGCITTPKEQRKLRKDINYLLKTTTNLKNLAKEVSKERMDQISSDIGKLKASTNADLDVIREDFSKIKGAREERDYGVNVIREKVLAIEESLKEVSKKISSIEEKLAEMILEAEAKKENSELAEEVAELKAAVAKLEAALGTGKAVTEEAKKDKKKAPDAETLYMKGYQATMEKDFKSAMVDFTEFLKHYPKNELADNAQYWVAEIYYAEGDYGKAILEFNKVLKNYSGGDKVAASLLKLGYSFENRGDIKEAKIILEKVIADHPKSKEAGHAKARLKKIEKK